MFIYTMETMTHGYLIHDKIKARTAGCAIARFMVKHHDVDIEIRNVRILSTHSYY